MAKYIIVRGDEVVAAVNTAVTDVTALPLFGGTTPTSLIRAYHFLQIQQNTGATPRQSVKALGITSPVLTALYATNQDPTSDEIWQALLNGLPEPVQP